MANDNIIILNDDEGSEVEFEFLDLIPYRSKEYVVLLPTSEDADEVVILQLEEADDETESYISVDNSAIQLLIGGGNLFISGCLLIIKAICWIITGLCGLITGIATRSFLAGIFATLAASISAGLIWLWTKFCMLFLMWSMRQNEFVADEYAYKLGYGEILASVLDNHMCSTPENGLLKALYSTHPHSDERVARLQELGCTYSRY